MIELQKTRVTAFVALDFLPRRTVHQHPLVAFSINVEVEVVRTVDAQIQTPIIECPRRQNQVASDTRLERLQPFRIRVRNAYLQRYSALCRHRRNGTCFVVL